MGHLDNMHVYAGWTEAQDFTSLLDSQVNLDVFFGQMVNLDLAGSIVVRCSLGQVAHQS